MLSAPSMRMTSPLSMVFSMICLTSDAYSNGRPNRGGKGTLWPSACCTSAGMPAIIGVSKMRGATVTALTPNRASSQAAGRVSVATPALEAA